MPVNFQPPTPNYQDTTVDRFGSWELGIGN